MIGFVSCFFSPGLAGLRAGISSQSFWLLQRSPGVVQRALLPRTFTGAGACCIIHEKTGENATSCQLCSCQPAAGSTPSTQSARTEELKRQRSMAEMPRRQQRRAPWQPSPTDPTEPTISARALAKARGTVEDFARSYMPLLGLLVDDVLCFADSLYFVAGSLYELDELNERGGDPSQAPAAAALRHSWPAAVCWTTCRRRST